jgi:hypothetical protein
MTSEIAPQFLKSYSGRGLERVHACVVTRVLAALRPVLAARRSGKRMASARLSKLWLPIRTLSFGFPPAVKLFLALPFGRSKWPRITNPECAVIFSAAKAEH